MAQRTCNALDCDRPHLARGLCSHHYEQWRSSSPDRPRCSVPGCDALCKGHGLCRKHLARLQHHGDPLDDRRRQRKPCSIEGCEKLTAGRGWCEMHWRRWREHGDPLTRLPMGPKPGTQRRPAEPRFWAKVNKAGPVSLHRPDLGSCWLWKAGTAGKGYGVFTPEPRHHVYAHRYAYELLIGPIPEGYEVDHLCRVRRCIRPTHLEAVTPEENRRRAQAANARPYCPWGHVRSGRWCRICRREQARARYARTRGAVPEVSAAVRRLPDPRGGRA